MEKVKGYKVFYPDWTCSPNGHTKQYTCPGMFEEEGELRIHISGIHFCEKLIDCFNYYDFDPKNHVAEVIAHGDVQKKKKKFCTNKLEIVRELTWEEVLQLVNIGEDNTGNCNTGNRNGGNYNTGDCNLGSHNTGDYNTGNYNTGNHNNDDYNTGSYNIGNCNIGNHNTGNYNPGNYNTGNRNAGDYNKGNYNVGNHNTGSYNIGNCNTGSRNTGNYNAGNHNTGYWNIQNNNTGDYNSGDYNTGNCNAGNYNAGNYNTGNYNTGHYNIGDYNTGDYNSGDYNIGCFNTTEPTILLFNQPSDWTYQKWLSSKARKLLTQYPRITTKWISFVDMTEEEKETYPSHITTGGYLKTEESSESAQSWWDNLTQENQAVIRSIPNFDAAIFEEITGIKVEE